jgi:hypothetical protein
MNAKELLIHDGSEGKSAERLHASIVYVLIVFMFALQFEREEVCQMSAFMVPPQ